MTQSGSTVRPPRGRTPARLRLTWLKYGLLHPVDFGGRIRSYQVLRRLAERHDVTYVALDDQVSGTAERSLAREYCRELVVVPHRRAPAFSPGFWWDLARNLASPRPYFVMAYESEALRRVLAERLRPELCDALVCDFPTLSVSLPDPLPVPSLLFQHNVEAEIWRRLAAIAPALPQKLYLGEQWRKARRFEREATRRFDRVAAVSEHDAGRLSVEYGLERITVIPTGVDVEAFAPQPGATVRPWHLVFTGALDWLPNEEGLLWFLRDVLPRVRLRLPEVTLTIAGRHPMAPLRRAVRAHTGVALTGRVEDIRPYLAEAALVVVPLRVGGGTRLKIFEAMAMNRPVVSTGVGAEGLPLEAGRDYCRVEDAVEFAAAIVRLLQRPEEARAMALRAGERVRRDHDWGGAAAAFDDLLRELVGAEPIRTPGSASPSPAAFGEAGRPG